MKYAVSGAPKKRAANRRNALKIGLAGIAIAGVGAALTSAAWTDNVWFSAPADAATFNLTASLDGTTWTETSEAAPLTIASSEFAKLLPGQTRTVTVHVKNESNVDAALTATPTIAGQLADAGLTVTASPTKPNLAAAETTTVTITVKVPEAWSETHKGKSGTVKLTGEGKPS